MLETLGVHRDLLITVVSTCEVCVYVCVCVRVSIPCVFVGILCVYVICVCVCVINFYCRHNLKLAYIHAYIFTCLPP